MEAQKEGEVRFEYALVKYVCPKTIFLVYSKTRFRTQSVFFFLFRELVCHKNLEYVTLYQAC